MPNPTLSIEEMMEQLSSRELEIERLRNDADSLIHEIRSRFEHDSAEPVKAQKLLRKRIAAAAKKVYDKDGVSMTQTAHGVVRVAKNPPKLVVENEANTLHALAALGRHDLIRIYQEPDLEAMSGESDENLSRWGIERRQTVSVHITVERAPIPAVKAVP